MTTKHYISPALEMIEISIERGFSATSGTVPPGGDVEPMSFNGDYEEF